MNVDLFQKPHQDSNVVLTVHIDSQEERDKSLEHFAVLAAGFQKALEMVQEEPLSDEMIHSLLPDY